MKRAFAIFTLIFLFSCQNRESCYECYLNQFPKHQKNSIIHLHELFEEFLTEEYPTEASTPDRLRSYCLDLTSVPGYLEKTSTEKAKLVMNVFQESTLDKEFRDWTTNTGDPYGLHYKALENCVSLDTDDSLVHNYLQEYRTFGDLSPDVFSEYIAHTADQHELVDQMLQHLFIVEYFVPRMVYVLRKRGELSMPNILRSIK